MNEPTYSFVKGQGWVLGFEDFKTINIGHWRFTVFNRKPVPGERCIFKSGTSFDVTVNRFFAAIKAQDTGPGSHFYQSEPIGYGYSYSDIFRNGASADRASAYLAFLEEYIGP